MAASLHRLPLGGCQSCQFGFGFLIRLASRSQPRTRPAPASLVQPASHAGAGEDQVEPCGQKGGQQTDRPARLDMARTGWGLARLGVHDRPSQRVLGRPSAAGLILQSGYALLLIAVQPGAHDLLPTGMHHRNPGDGETSVGEQDQSPRARPRARSPGGSGWSVHPVAFASRTRRSSFSPPALGGCRNCATHVTMCLEMRDQLSWRSAAVRVGRELVSPLAAFLSSG